MRRLGALLPPRLAARPDRSGRHGEARLQDELAADDDEAALITALTEQYAYVYARPTDDVPPVAVHRARVMRISDAWVADGCDLADPQFADGRRGLVESCTRLLDVGRTA